MGIFKEKSTFAKFREKITNVIVGNPNLDEDFLDELEESLIIADIGIDTTEKIMEQLRERVNARYITKPEEVQKALESVIADLVDKGERNQLCKENPLIILMIGINGGGKTTSIGKIANLCQNPAGLSCWRRRIPSVRRRRNSCSSGASESA